MDQVTPAAPFAHQQTPYVHPILSGALWRKRVDGPWPPAQPTPRVTVLGTADGWVRFRVNELLSDVRWEEDIFRSCYECDDSHLDPAEDLRARFEAWAGAKRWNLERYGEGCRGYTGQYKWDVTEYGWGAFVAGARGYCS